MEIDEIIRQALEEDIGSGDATSIATIPEARNASAKIVAEEAGILCGIEIAEKIFRTYDPKLEFRRLCKDGQRISKGNVLAEITGKARSLLACERTALNFLQRLSRIATTASEFVAKVSGTIILDTRKTSPLLRELEKYAVRCGGAKNHRFGLYDMVLIKDNHIEVAGSISQAVSSARKRYPGLMVEVEAESLEMVREALAAGTDRIMLDNMSLADMRLAVKEVGKRTALEASGGVTLENVQDIAATGVDYISIGSSLTNVPKSLDISMDIFP